MLYKGIKKIKKNEAREKFLKDKAFLWWWVKDVKKISDAAMLEGALNYGDWDEAKKIFKDVFSEKNFYQQLTYFKDIDYSEEVHFMPGFSVSDEKIKKYLRRAGIEAGKIIINLK